MSVAAGVLLVLAGLSETLGRIVPLVARRHRATRATVVRLLVLGTGIQALVFAAWPLLARTLTCLVRLGTIDGSTVASAPGWTAGSLAPLLFCAVLAFPLLGPALHLLVLVLAGIALSEQLVAAGTGWWEAACCVAVAGGGLALLLAAARRAVGAWGAVPLVSVS
ncbi:MAG: hypothetical protein QOE59_3616 [Actinomycetota bacterium]|jgi:hypothetical protein|nr:hypothetical protein [Actinomycetota bacterium]